MDIPDVDMNESRENTANFVVAKKEVQGNKWINIKEYSVLSDALNFCRLYMENNIRVSIWVKGENGNFLYWDSRFPDLFNSNVLDLM